MNRGCFYSVGTGPGDSKLLTLLAVETIRRADVIAVPDSGAKENAVLNIVADYIADKEIRSFSMPMTRNKEEQESCHQQAAETIAALLDQGKQVAFLTLGDSTIYATPMYLHKRLQAMGYDTKIIPGVPSFCAAAAALGQPLCEGRQMLHIVPGSYGDLEKTLELSGTRVLMKSGKSMGQVKELLLQRGEQAMAVERCGMEGQTLYPTLEQLPEDPGYFCVVIAKEKEQ